MRYFIDFFVQETRNFNYKRKAQLLFYYLIVAKIPLTWYLMIDVRKSPDFNSGMDRTLFKLIFINILASLTPIAIMRN